MKNLMETISSGYVSNTARARLQEYQMETIRQAAGTSGFASLAKPAGQLPGQAPLSPVMFRMPINKPPDAPTLNRPKETYTSELAPPLPVGVMSKPAAVTKPLDAPRMHLKMSTPPVIPIQRVNLAKYKR